MPSRALASPGPVGVLVSATAVMPTTCGRPSALRLAASCGISHQAGDTRELEALGAGRIASARFRLWCIDDDDDAAAGFEPIEDDDDDSEEMPQ
jgi:hypothetical protein